MNDKSMEFFDEALCREEELPDDRERFVPDEKAQGNIERTGQYQAKSKTRIAKKGHRHSGKGAGSDSLKSDAQKRHAHRLDNKRWNKEHSAKASQKRDDFSKQKDIEEGLSDRIKQRSSRS